LRGGGAVGGVAGGAIADPIGGITNNFGIPNISISAQNCNSLNLTGISLNLETKVAAITATGTDLIFISDIRLVNANGVPSDERVRTAFRDAKHHSYESFFNSTKNSRGVGILISNKLNFGVVEQRTDQDQNFIVLKVKINDKIGIFGSIYGPNSMDRNFFTNLERAINQLRGNDPIPIIIGGDWNTTWDRRAVHTNIDTFHMAGLPNPQNGSFLGMLCDRLDLLDPYRSLYPNKREFTYQPFGNVRLNRSRIDFFCVSSSMLDALADCNISSSVLCSLFDHRNIKILFDTDPVPNKSRALSNRFLDSKILKFVIQISSYRCHLYSVDIVDDAVTGLVNAGKLFSNTVWNNIKNYFDLELKAAQGLGAVYGNLAAAELTNIELMLSEHENYEIVANMAKRCTHTEFFTALTEEIKKNGIWAQKKLFNLTKVKIGSLEKRVIALRNDFEANFGLIFDIEKKIAKIRDDELRCKLMDLKIFECLNAEKASPHFLHIANKSKKECDIDNICDDNGANFPDAAQREEHIVSFYSDLYKIDNNVEGEIADFLGPDIIATPQIKASKLTEREREELDSPLLIEELDKSLKQVNLKSSPGIDGYSYRFIKRFWDFFRLPLFKCANEALETGVLPESFLTAQIKIIPKKGDTSKIKNWRPISLLSNFYKIISRLINNRLKKVANRIMSRGQKGFNQSRQLQEVILNSLENMEFCKKNNVKGALLSIDMAKAFDSVAHSYMEKVYRRGTHLPLFYITWPHKF